VFADNGGLGFIEAAKEGTEFWANKVRKESKDKGAPAHMAWANLQRDSFSALYEFVKSNYKTGLTWNPKGGDAAAALAGSAAATPTPAVSVAAAAPAPAPAPAPAAAAAAAPSATVPKASLTAVFAQIGSIDQSSGKTAGLRHVDKKAVAEEKAKAAPISPAPAPAARAKPSVRDGGAPFPTGTARCVKEELRWLVDFQVDNKAAPLHLTDVTIREEVYIYGCQNAVIYIDSKVKGVRLDTCRDVIVFIDSALSGVEVVNSRKIKLQVVKSLPSVAIDKTDGIVVGLSFASRGAQIVTSKSSEMNVTFPAGEGEESDWLEMPIPEQFVSKIHADGKMTTTVSDLYSH